MTITRTGEYIRRMGDSQTAHLADELRAGRARRRMTQAQLAAASGVSAKSIHLFEREKAYAKSWQLVNLASALDVPAHTLLLDQRIDRPVGGS